VRSRSDSPTAPREARRARLDPPAIREEGDDTGWLTTFSDLVLQLFGFVILVAAIGGAQADRAVARPAPATTALPVARPETKPPREVRPASAAASGTSRALAPVPRVQPDLAALVSAPDQLPAPATAPAPEQQPAPVPASDPAVRAGDGARTPAVRPALAAMAERLQAVAEASGHGEGVTVAAIDGAVVVGITDAVAFPSASAQLSREGMSLLAHVRTLALAVPELAIEVTGHTDDRPIRSAAFPSNLELSLARAASVARALADDPALAGRVTARGVGEHRPIAPNADPDGRARNRRVEIRLVPVP